MHNEAAQIDGLVQSVTASHWKPDLWLIVDDASTDETPRKLAEYQRQFPFIRMHRLPRQDEYMGFHISKVFQEGIAAAGDLVDRADYIGFLDADIRFGPSYWLKLKNYLDSHPRTGIVSGVLCSKNTQGEWQVEPFQRIDNPRGGLRLVKKECFVTIGGVPYSRAWDPVMNVKARTSGWKVSVLPDVFAVSVRPTDERFSRIEGELSRGQRDWHLHQPFFQILTRAFFKALKGNPKAARYYVKGYVKEWRAKGQRFPDPKVRRYYRYERSKEWLSIIGSKFSGKPNPHRFIPVRVIKEEDIFK